MKTWPIVALIGLSSVLSTTSFADEVEIRPLQAEAPANQASLPTDEKGFVDAISKYDKAAIVALLGDPAKADDVKLKDSGKIVASIWHYHNINTDKDGAYYETTELDFLEDKVVQVVFLNNDGSEKADGQKYEINNNTINPDALGDGVPLLDMGK